MDLPPEMEGIAHLIIGYPGNICHRLDYDLLAAVFEKNRNQYLYLNHFLIYILPQFCQTKKLEKSYTLYFPAMIS